MLLFFKLFERDILKLQVCTVIVLPKRWYPITIWRNNPEDLNLNLHLRDSLTSRMW